MRCWAWSVYVAVVAIYNWQDRTTQIAADVEEVDDELLRSPFHDRTTPESNSSFSCNCPSTSVISPAIGNSATSTDKLCIFHVLWNAVSFVCVIVQFFRGIVRRGCIDAQGVPKCTFKDFALAIGACKNLGDHTSTWAEGKMLRETTRNLAKARMAETSLTKQVSQIADERDSQKKELQSMISALAKTREQLLQLARASENKDATISDQAEMLKACIEEKEKFAIKCQIQEQEICSLEGAIDKALALLTNSDVQPASMASSSTQMFDSSCKIKGSKKQPKDATPLDLKECFEFAEPSLCRFFLTSTQVGNAADQSAGMQQGPSREGIHAFPHWILQHSDLMDAFMDSREAQLAHSPCDVDAKDLVKQDEQTVGARAGLVIDADRAMAALFSQPVNGTFQSPRGLLKATSSRVRRLARRFERGATPDEMADYASEEDCALPSILEEPPTP